MYIYVASKSLFFARSYIKIKFRTKNIITTTIFFFYSTPASAKSHVYFNTSYLMISIMINK